MKKIALAAAALVFAAGGAFAQSATGAHGPNYEDRPSLWTTSRQAPTFQSSAGITPEAAPARAKRPTVPVIQNGAGNDRDHAVYISGPIVTQH
jgi:hypothetical protein